MFVNLLKLKNDRDSKPRDVTEKLKAPNLKKKLEH